MDRKVRLIFVPVPESGGDKSSFIDTYCLLYNGSEISLCTKSLLHKLQIHGQPTIETISGVNGMQSQHGYSVALRVRGAHEMNAILFRMFLRLTTFPKLEAVFLGTKMCQCMSIWKASGLPEYLLVNWSS